MEKFYGTWKLERSENFEEYLTARNVPWIIKKAMIAANVTKIFSKSENQKDTYTLVNKYPIKTVTLTFKFNETVESVSLDNKKHAVTFDLKDGVFYETHVRLEEEDKTPHVYRYEREGDYVVVVLQEGEIICKRYFKKQEK